MWIDAACLPHAEKHRHQGQDDRDNDGDGDDDEDRAAKANKANKAGEAKMGMSQGPAADEAVAFGDSDAPPAQREAQVWGSATFGCVALRSAEAICYWS